jgi:uncharacterized protein involved in exopolysaccharide biosynthesis
MMTPQLTDTMLGQRAAPARKELNLRDLALTIWRYKVLIVSIVVVMTGLSHLYINSLTPRYRAEASLVLDIRRANVGIDPVVAEQRPDEGVIRSEVDVLRPRLRRRRPRRSSRRCSGT